MSEFGQCSWCAGDLPKKPYRTRRNYCSVPCRAAGSPYFYSNKDAFLPDGFASFKELVGERAKAQQPKPLLMDLLRCFGSLAAAADVLESKIDYTDDCWVWTGARTTSGYGRLVRRLNKRRFTFRVHRAAFVIQHRREPLGDVLRHTCDNRLCVNPDHLLEGSYKDNSIDASQRARITGQALDETKVRVIRAAAADGVSATELATLFGVSKVCIRRVVAGKDYAWVA